VTRVVRVAAAQTALHEKGVCVFLYVILADMADVRYRGVWGCVYIAQTVPTHELWCDRDR
jgi:hypothetical protein